MGLAGDINEAKKLWNESSPLFRVVIVISTFLAISSIASMSDVIFHWKGFISDGLQFYNSWAIEPLKKFALKFDHSIYERNLNFIIVIGLLNAGLIRVYLNETYRERYLLIFFIIFNYGNMIKIHIFGTSIVSTWEIIFLPLVLVSLYLFKTPIKIKILYFTPIIFSILSTLILAAINSGLTKTT